MQLTKCKLINKHDHIQILEENIGTEPYVEMRLRQQVHELLRGRVVLCRLEVLSQNALRRGGGAADGLSALCRSVADSVIQLQAEYKPIRERVRV